MLFWRRSSSEFIKVFSPDCYYMYIPVEGMALDSSLLDSSYPRMLCIQLGWNRSSGSQEEDFQMSSTIFFFYFLAKSYMYSWKKACHFIGTNLCCVQQSECPRTFADWTIALTSFSIVQSANVRGRSLSWTQHWIPLRQECFVCQVVLEKKMKTYNDDDDDDIWQKAHTRRKWLNSITMQRTSSKYTYTSLKLGWQLSDFQSFHLSSDLFPVRFVSLNPISKANFVAEEGKEIFVTNWQKTIYNIRIWIIVCC